MVDKSGPQKNQDRDTAYSFVKKVLIFVAIAISISLLVLFLGYAVHILLLVFVGILFGTILRSLSDLITNTTGIPGGVSLAIVVLFIVCLAGGSGYLLAPHVFDQAENLYNSAPEHWNNIKKQIWQYSWGREIALENPDPKDLLSNEGDDGEESEPVTRNLLNFFSITANAAVSIIIVVVIGIYIAAEPEVYRRGLLRLFPHRERPLVSQILDETALVIQWWLVGQIVSMLILGTITTIGLYLIGMPYPLILGIFTALMTFIPNLGPVLAGIPTLLVAFTVSVEMAIYVAIFYVIIQSIEGYFITPMIHREMISVPPVLIISFQFLLYYLIGFIGVFVAMPLVACLMIIIQRVYVEKILGDSMGREIDIDQKGKTIF